MKLNIQPALNKSIIINTNGSSYKKNWLVFKTLLKLETDSLKKPLWKKTKLNKNNNKND